MKIFLLLIIVLPLLAITDVGGIIDSNTVWGPTGNPPDTVYNLINYVEILDGVTLTIQPGVRIQSLTYGFMVYGRLIACGTTQEKILFTSASTTPNPGDWTGITFEFDTTTTDTSIINNCIIEYGRGIYSLPYTFLRIDSSVIRRNEADGIVCGINTVIENNEIYENVRGIYCGSEGDTGTVYIGNNVIRNNDNGLCVSGPLLPIFSSPNQFFSNNVNVLIEADVYIKNYVDWNPAVGGVDCIAQGQFIIDTTGTLRIAPGNIFKLWPTHIWVYGNLIAHGNPSSKITFTSTSANPAPGDWQNIIFFSSAMNTTMENCLIEYADWGAVFFNDSMVIRECEIRNCNLGLGVVGAGGTISRCKIQNNGRGIDVCGPLKDMYAEENMFNFNYDFIIGIHRDSMVSFDSNTITNNQIGIYCEYSGYPYIQYNEIYNNIDYGVYNYDNNYWIYAENNWWGDSTGPRDTSSVDTLYNPAGLGDRVSDHVDYQPWLDYPVFVEEHEDNNQIKKLASNFFKIIPNPFTDNITISFYHHKAGSVILKTYNMAGQLISYQKKDAMPEGTHTIMWNCTDDFGRGLPAGVYIIKLETQGTTSWQKIIKIK